MSKSDKERSPAKKEFAFLPWLLVVVIGLGGYLGQSLIEIMADRVSANEKNIYEMGAQINSGIKDTHLEIQAIKDDSHDQALQFTRALAELTFEIKTAISHNDSEYKEKEVNSSNLAEAYGSSPRQF